MKGSRDPGSIRRGKAQPGKKVRRKKVDKRMGDETNESLGVKPTQGWGGTTLGKGGREINLQFREGRKPPKRRGISIEGECNHCPGGYI